MCLFDNIATQEESLGMRRKIYCAGPLFNPKEREEMQEIAEVIESCNVSTFLPQRDGVKYADLIEKFRNNDLSNEEADKILKKIIFYLDIYQVMEKTQALVLNLNGRVPDEGAVVEAALAWLSGKMVFIYKTDDRSLINGTDNPLVLGLNDFDVIRSKEELKVRVEKWEKNEIQENKINLDKNIKIFLEKGRKISSYLEKNNTLDDFIKFVKTL